MSRSWVLYLRDMSEAARKIVRYTGSRQAEAFLADEMAYDAALRNLEILGEAAKAIPEEIRQRHPEIDWRGVIGLRDVLAHTYFALDDFGEFSTPTSASSWSCSRRSKGIFLDGGISRRGLYLPSTRDFEPAAERSGGVPHQLSTLRPTRRAEYARMSASVFSRDPEVMGGTAVFPATRVPVQTLLDYLEAGESIDDFLGGFPSIKREQVIAFLRAATERLVAPTP